MPRLRPHVVALAKRLARRKPKGGKLSLRAISAALAAEGHLNERGKPFAAQAIASMLTKPMSLRAIQFRVHKPSGEGLTSAARSRSTITSHTV